MSQAACTGMTKRGDACRSFALPGRATCLTHTPELRAKVEAARRRGGTVAMKLRTLQGKRLKLDTSRALVRFVGDVVQDTLAGTVEPDVARAVLYGCSILRALSEHDLERRLAEVERLLSQRRTG